MWIKICGNTNLEDARLAAEGGADALGFVFARSPRQVTAAQARRIAAELPPEIETYGVFVNAMFAEIVETVTAAGLTGVQLHDSRPQDSGEANLPARLREHFAQRPTRLSILGVLKWSVRKDLKPEGPGAPDQQAASIVEFDHAAQQYSRDPAVDAVLVDSWTAEAAGGTGTRFDWNAAQSSFLRADPPLRLIVAGGLRPENVRDAISVLKPWGVDVVSGVEAVPGKKDPARLLAFLRAAREAAAEESERRK